jgi:protease-4
MLTGEINEREGKSNSLVGIPYAHEYFGTWAIKPEEFQGHWSWFQRTDLHLHVAKSAEEIQAMARDAGLYGVTKDGTAIIELNGTLMKQISSMSRGTSTVLARRQIRAAMKDTEVSAILLRIDSPGGTAAGTQELADDVAAAAKEKPVYAFIEDLGASAAYWVASQASKVFTNSTGIVGSIGTYMAVMDLSGMAAKEGIKVHVIRAGEFKGAGTPGTEVTAAQLAEWQKTVDGLNEHFVRGVASGRKLTLEKTRALADGRVYVGKAALENGLVDGVQTLDATLAQLSSLTSRRSKSMSQEATVAAAAAPLKPGPANYHELEAALVGADATFIASQLKANATLTQATSAWMVEQNTRLAAANDKAEKAAAGKGPGVKPLGTKPAKSEDADESMEMDVVEQFNGAVAKIAGDNPTLERRQSAVAAVARKNPDLHRAFLLSTNTSKKAHRQIEEKYDEAAV